jgi:para-nitrobenzyl esterase
MKRYVGLVLCGIFLLRAAQNPATNQDPIKVEQGQLSGASGAKPGVRVYLGIPYAAPPVGSLRWKAPQPAQQWQGVRQATAFGNSCMQVPYPPTSVLFTEVSPTESEDCLYLNIWTPAKSGAEHLPVMVWIHGGGFAHGAGGSSGYDGTNLAAKGAVIVTINYRLGVFGFFALPELTAESAHHASGNYGLMDQIAALEWVKKNISAFGGDPNCVTIFGESAGSVAVNILQASPLAKGLFQRAIGESGADLGPIATLAQGERDGEKMAAAAGVTQQLLKTLRAMPAQDLLKAIDPGDASEIVDGWVLPKDSHTIFAAGKQNDVPLIVGNNANEGTIFPPPDGKISAETFIKNARENLGKAADDFLKIYPAGSDEEALRSYYSAFRDQQFGWGMRAWARLQSQTGRQRAYRYYFDRVPPGPRAQRRGAFHGAEIAYVFETFIFRVAYDDTDHNLGDAVSSYWVNFAKTGDPNGAGLPQWPAYNPANDNVMEFGDQVSVATHVNQAGLNFFDVYYESLAAAEEHGGAPGRVP